MLPSRPVHSWAPQTPSICAEPSGHGTVWPVIERQAPLVANLTALAPYNATTVDLDEDSSICLVKKLVLRDGAAVSNIDKKYIDIGAAGKVPFHTMNEGIALQRLTLSGK